MEMVHMIMETGESKCAVWADRQRDLGKQTVQIKSKDSLLKNSLSFGEGSVFLLYSGLQQIG